MSLDGEIGVVLRHLNDLIGARYSFQSQYHQAKQLGHDGMTCRAIGNLGIVNYQLWQQRQDPTLLTIAIQQLKERIERAGGPEMALERPSVDLSAQIKFPQLLAIGLSRLSVCYTAQGEGITAIHFGQQGLRVARVLRDPNITAMSQFFYGRALLRNGDIEGAKGQFNRPDTYSPVIALCKEPSQENHSYLRELIDLAVDMELKDEEGYTALDYAVFNEDSMAADIVLEGVRTHLCGDIDTQLERRRSDSVLRTLYRKIFQEQLRPSLLSAPFLLPEYRTQQIIHTSRMMHLSELRLNEERADLLDSLKFVKYTDFKQLERIPTLYDGYTKSPTGLHDGMYSFIIFLSYVRVKGDDTTSMPDDVNNSHHSRMVSAIEDFLNLHPEVARDEVAVWVVSPPIPNPCSHPLRRSQDCACVDQENPLRGISTLPITIAQCDVVISLVNNDYYSRAWCCFEVMMIQTLRRSYRLHFWYEQVRDEVTGGWSLREGDVDMEVSTTGKLLSFEEDRVRLEFLEGQCRLLG